LDIFWDRVSWTICPGWFWTEILLISASWVARITGMSHQCKGDFKFLFTCFVVLGIKLRASTFLGKFSATRTPPPVLSHLVCFSDKVSCQLCLGWPQMEILIHLPPD
jgi:hypothetical protein